MRGNHALFIKKDLRKGIYTKSRPKTNLSTKNYFAYKKIVCHNEEFDMRIMLQNIKHHSSTIKIKNNMSVKCHLSSNNTSSSARPVTG